MAGATLIDANAAGRPVPLVADGQALVALIPGPSPFALALEWGAPLAFRPGRASFLLPVPQAGAARASIDLPGEQADVRLSAGVITRRTVAGGRTIVEATLDPGSTTEVWWSMRDSAPVAAARDVRTLADVLTLITLNDSDVRMAALIDVTVPRGELRTLSLRLPAGYEFTSVTGNSLEASELREGEVVLTVANPAARNHQFLVTLERPHAGGPFDLETGLVSVRDVQRERGEVAIEALGTMDLNAKGPEGLHRIDVRELNRSLHSLARLPVLSAFRYQRPSGAAVPTLALGVKRFADAGVLAAVADSATATTLVTTEGTGVDRGAASAAQPVAGILEGDAAGRRRDGVGRAGGRTGQAVSKRGWHARAADARRAADQPALRRVVRLPPRRHAVRPQGRHSDGPAENGHPDRRRQLGSVRAGAILGPRDWRQRPRSHVVPSLRRRTVVQRRACRHDATTPTPGPCVGHQRCAQTDRFAARFPTRTAASCRA